ILTNKHFCERSGERRKFLIGKWNKGTGRRFSDLTYLIADTSSFVPLTNEKLSAFTAPLAKVLVSLNAAIAYAGNTFYVPESISITRPIRTFDALVGALVGLIQTSCGEIEFLAAN